jgi:lantibiotic modifying enzyme
MNAAHRSCRANTLETETMTGWEPVLHGMLAERADEIVADIADNLPNATDMSAPDPGAPLLYAYLAVERRSDVHLDRSLEALERLGDRAAGVRSAGLYGGLAGIAFVTQHVGTTLADWIDPDESDPCEDADRALLEVVRAQGARRTFDLLDGLAGIATYAQERLPRAPARALIAAIVDRLAQDAEHTAQGATWRTWHLGPDDPRAQEHPQGIYNLGVAHGVPAVIVALARAVCAGIEVERTRPLLESSVQWLIAQVSDRADARIPRWIPASGAAATELVAREMWCQGGLGISVALLLAARLVARADWEATALTLARREAGRGTTDQAHDACLCHGAAGNGHLYNRLYQATGDEVFLAAAERWLASTIDRHRPGVGIGGFLFLKDRMVASAGLMDGSAGVGLALLAATGRTRPAWDRLLLADIPPPIR